LLSLSQGLLLSCCVLLGLILGLEYGLLLLSQHLVNKFLSRLVGSCTTSCSFLLFVASITLIIVHCVS
jgi:hypothetical protein